MIAFDDEVDERSHDVEQQVETLLARQTPVATDLRRVLAVLHINIHLERMADRASRSRSSRSSRAPLDGPAAIVEGLEEMGSRAEEMTKRRARLVRRAVTSERPERSPTSTS